MMAKEATLTAVLPPPADVPLVGIYSAYDMSRLVAVIELVSPGNKDRPEATQAFVEKMLFYATFFAGRTAVGDG